MAASSTARLRLGGLVVARQDHRQRRLAGDRGASARRGTLVSAGWLFGVSRLAAEPGVGMAGSHGFGSFAARTGHPAALAPGALGGSQTRTAGALAARAAQRDAG